MDAPYCCATGLDAHLSPSAPRSAFGPKLRRLRTMIALESTAAAACLVE